MRNFIETEQKRLFGWQILQVENPDTTYGALFRTKIEPNLPSSSGTLQFTIKSVFVGRPKEQLDKVNIASFIYNRFYEGYLLSLLILLMHCTTSYI